MVGTSRTLSIVGGIFFLIALIAACFNAVHQFESVWKMAAALIITCGLLFFAAYWTCFRMTRKMFLIVVLAIGLAIRLVWILWNPSLPASDFLFLYNAALQAASGDFSFAGTPYYISFPYQLGFTMYEASIIRLFSNALFTLKLLNILFSLGAMVLLYMLTSKVFNERCGRIAMLFYMLYIPNIIMCSVLTNQHIAIFLFLLGLMLLMRSTSTRDWLLAGLLLGIGSMMRPIGVIFLAAIVLYFIFTLFKNWQTTTKKNGILAAVKLIILIVAFYLIQFFASTLLISTGVTQHSLSGGDRYWKFMVGLNAETNGAWSAEDAKYANQFSFGEERHRAELSRIKERLENKTEVAALLGRKLVQMWGSADSSAYWSLQGMNRLDLERLLSKWAGIEYLLICAFGLVAMIALWRSGQVDEPILYLILLLLYVAAHLLIEIQTRYRLDMIPVMMLLQSYGVYQVCSWSGLTERKGKI